MKVFILRVPIFWKVSTELSHRSVGKGRVDYIDKAWSLKEEIREEDGVLRQPRVFFRSAYAENISHLYLNTENDIVGFGVVRPDGYIPLLGVKSEFRNQGIGKRLIERMHDGREEVSCHTRVSNEGAVEFYRSIGFQVVSYIDSYYASGDPAYYLVRESKE